MPGCIVTIFTNKLISRFRNFQEVPCMCTNSVKSVYKRDNYVEKMSSSHILVKSLWFLVTHKFTKASHRTVSVVCKLVDRPDSSSISDRLQTRAPMLTDCQGAGDATISPPGLCLILWSIPDHLTRQFQLPERLWCLLTGLQGLLLPHQRRSVNPLAAPRGLSDGGPALQTPLRAR